MKFKIDENLPDEVAEILNRSSHDAVTVLQQDMGGKEDSDIAKVCRNEDRVIVTLDIDFADILTYPPDQYPGIIVFRITNQSKPSILKHVKRVVKVLALHSCQQQLWIVEKERIRVRSST